MYVKTGIESSPIKSIIFQSRARLNSEELLSTSFGKASELMFASTVCSSLGIAVANK